MPKWNLPSHIYCSTIHNSQNMESTYMSVDSWMDKENIVYTQQNIIQPYEKWNSVICSNLDETGGHYVKWNKSCTERQIPHVLTSMWKFKIDLKEVP
jgi:hypothetical protein